MAIPSVYRNVIILGAGASYPFGFPTGEQLIKEVLSSIKQFQSFIENWRPVTLHPDSAFQYHDFLWLDFMQGTQSHDLKALIDELSQPFWDSIDEFIDKYPDFSDVLKKIIAYIFLQKEDVNFYHRMEKDPWFKYFATNSKSRLLSDNPDIAFVTFNYERSLEYLLHNMFLSLDKKNAFKRLTSIPVLHVYGSLGKIISNNSDDKNFYPFGIFSSLRNKIYQHQYKYVNSNLRTIFETQQEGTELADIRTVIYNAQNIYITGFGFNQKNCDLIFLKCDDTKRIFINTYDRTPKEINEIKNTLSSYYLDTRISTNNATEQSNYRFMREYLFS